MLLFTDSRSRCPRRSARQNQSFVLGSFVLFSFDMVAFFTTKAECAWCGVPRAVLTLKDSPQGPPTATNCQPPTKPVVCCSKALSVGGGGHLGNWGVVGGGGHLGVIQGVLCGSLVVLDGHLGHEASDTGLAYAPVSQAHGHHHTQFNVLPCCTAAQTSSVPTVDSHAPLWVAFECALAVPVSSLPPPSHSAGKSLTSRSAGLSLCLRISSSSPSQGGLSYSSPSQGGFSSSSPSPQVFLCPSHPCVCASSYPPHLLVGTTQAYRRSHSGVLSNV